MINDLHMRDPSAEPASDVDYSAAMDGVHLGLGTPLKFAWPFLYAALGALMWYVILSWLF